MPQSAIKQRGVYFYPFTGQDLSSARGRQTVVVLIPEYGNRKDRSLVARVEVKGEKITVDLDEIYSVLSAKLEVFELLLPERDLTKTKNELLHRIQAI
jgi:hypothetical protein